MLRMIWSQSSTLGDTALVWSSNDDSSHEFLPRGASHG
jgi:hypothetical protein